MVCQRVVSFWGRWVLLAGCVTPRFQVPKAALAAINAGGKQKQVQETGSTSVPRGVELVFTVAIQIPDIVHRDRLPLHRVVLPVARLDALHRHTHHRACRSLNAAKVLLWSSVQSRICTCKHPFVTTSTSISQELPPWRQHPNITGNM
eukprot:783056-Rhodomonas_salina.3